MIAEDVIGSGIGALKGETVNLQSKIVVILM